MEPQDNQPYTTGASSFSWGGAVDSFSQLLGQYAQYRLAEKQAELTGASQAALNNSVEKPYQTGAVPNQQTTATETGFQFDQQTMLIGGAVLLGAILLLK